jgi:hypothetical protein
LLLLISEISLGYSNHVFHVEISVGHVDLDDRSVPLGMPKDMLMQKWIYKHKGIIPDSTLRRASQINLTTNKGDNSNTLVLTKAMRPDAMTKRYSRGT